MRFQSISRIKNLAALRNHLLHSNIDLPFDDELLPPAKSLFAQPYPLSGGFTIGNRFCIQPMEGWDCTPSGAPSELTFRRWENFGRSGAKLIWGGEAAAIRHDGRANPNQLLINEANLPAIMQLRQRLVETHAAFYGNTSDLLIGLQLTHSGRYAQPNRKGVAEPLTLYRHPYLDPRLGIRDDFPASSQTIRSTR